MPSYLITGASRGIGLTAVAELLEDPQNVVVATARDPFNAKGLQDLAAKYPSDRLALVRLDLTDLEGIDRAAEEAAEILPNGLDYLINNAAITQQNDADLDSLDLEMFEEELRINTVRQVYVLRKFVPLIRKGAEKKVAFITSDMASLEWAPMFGSLCVAYAACKAALNILARRFGSLLSTEGICVILLHPGWVDTDMGNSVAYWVNEHIPGKKPITAKESTQGFLKVLQEVKVDKNVKYLNWEGNVLPW